MFHLTTKKQNLAKFKGKQIFLTSRKVKTKKAASIVFEEHRSPRLNFNSALISDSYDGVQNIVLLAGNYICPRFHFNFDSNLLL